MVTSVRTALTSSSGDPELYHIQCRYQTCSPRIVFTRFYVGIVNKSPESNTVKASPDTSPLGKKMVGKRQNSLPKMGYKFILQNTYFNDYGWVFCISLKAQSLLEKFPVLFTSEDQLLQWR